MSGVDVVAVWDREIDAFRKTEVMIAISVPERRQAYADQLASLTAARAAVAELIEAGNDWCDLMPGLAGGPEFDRLTAALANVGSAS